MAPMELDNDILHAFKAFSSTSLTINIKPYHNMIWFGVLGGVGSVFLKFYTAGNSTIEVKDVMTGANYSNAKMTVSYSSNTLSISFTNSSNGLLISDGFSFD